MLSVAHSPHAGRVPARHAAFPQIVFLCLLAVCLAAPGRAAATPTKSPTRKERKEGDAPHAEAPDGEASQAAGHGRHPHVAWALPFILLLAGIALLPIIPGTAHWWESNRHRLVVAVALSAVAAGNYLFRDYGYHTAEPGLASLGLMLKHALLDDYVPFITLLFSLYVISGGIAFRGDIPARPPINTAFLTIGALAASFIGTTGVAMLLIRPLLRVNSRRRHVRHTVIFFIFLVCNVGGCLLPVGDPPLFLGYLRGVPFLWTLHLLPQWALTVALLLAIYFVWDSILYRFEDKNDLRKDTEETEPFQLLGRHNLYLLGGVVLAVALLSPGRRFLGTPWRLPNIFLREIVLIALALASLRYTPRRVRAANDFNFLAMAEVACLFIGVFITMQVPLEILRNMGPTLGLTEAWQYFWATGALSSFLDNAPTYVVFFEMAKTMPHAGVEAIALARSAPGSATLIPANLLAAVSCGAVFMGAITYLGNGPNFMVRSIANHSGVRMPSFFGYMLYSLTILVPVLLVVSWVFFS